MRVRSLPRLLLLVSACVLATTALRAGAPRPEAVAAWDKYVRLTEARIERDLNKPTTEPASTQIRIARMRTLNEDGEPIEAPDAMFHHWKGSIFLPGARLDAVLKFVQDYDSHQRYFKEVEKSRLLSRKDNTFRIFYRLKRTKVITVVYNTEHTVVYRIAGPHGASSRSVATRIVELDDPGKASEREKSPDEERGFLWRLNSYWRFTERDGGVIVECESISLSRDIPTGLGWLIKGYVESVPRESLSNTLTSLRNGIR